MNSVSGFESGIFRCDIATTSVHSDVDISTREVVYVGIYGGTSLI